MRRCLRLQYYEMPRKQQLIVRYRPFNECRSPSLSLMRPMASAASTSKAVAHSKATQMTSASSSASSSPEAVTRKVHKPASTIPKCHRERGQGDGSPNGSTSGLSDQVTALASPSQSLLDYLLPIKNQFEAADDASKSRYVIHPN